MTDEKTPREEWEENGTTCPFCGNEEYAAPCAHMLADFAYDRDDNSGGVCGEGFSQSVVREPARELGRACVGLLDAVYEDEGDWESRLANLRAITKDDPANWWRGVVAIVEDNGAGIPDTDTGRGYFATDVVLAIAQLVPDVLVSDFVAQGMASGDTYFLWAEDREAGTTALQTRIGEATEEVRRVAAVIVTPEHP